ncbi:MAG: membrane protein insertion efficiency factor YidD [Deltaproteobacteria bacterium]|nr:membrane protein insertion efficiency factor YidD [Deltaproteobacteria bacterium]
MKTFLYLVIVCWSLVLPVPSPAHDPDPSGNGPNSESSLPLFPISFYQKIISPAVGNRCQMSPSCSAYSKEAFQTHGFFLGWIMTCDRLMRCGRDETDVSPGVWTPEGRLTLDPLSANDSWMK